MKKFKFKQRSFVFSCVSHFTIFVLLTVIIYSGFSYVFNLRINREFFSLEELLVSKKDLKSEKYSAILRNDSKNSSFIVFDKEGQVKYASDKKIKEQVFFDSLELIPEYHSNMFFDVFQKEAPDKTIQYMVYLNDYSKGNKTAKTKAYCILNESLEIIEGALFADRGALTKTEFDLLNGITRSNGDVEKYSYQTKTGEKRILAFLSNEMTEKQYKKIGQSANRIWLIGIPCIVITIILFAILFCRMVRSHISPINQAIIAYNDGEAVDEKKLGVPIEFSGVLRNFKGLLKQLKETLERNETLNNEKKQLIADISHDLKTPLTVIQGYSEALDHHKVPEEKKEQYVKAIYRKSVLATDMVNKLFLFTQMEHPDYQLTLEYLDFNEFIKSFFAEKYREIDERGLNLEIEIPEKQCIIPFDHSLLRRMLENLLENSLKYNQEGTTLFVELREKKSLILNVGDDGVGIPNEIAASLFQPFITGNHARTTGKGTGLGLSIVKRVVEMHHGSIELATSENKQIKTNFKIFIPKAQD